MWQHCRINLPLHGTLKIAYNSTAKRLHISLCSVFAVTKFYTAIALLLYCMHGITPHVICTSSEERSKCSPHNLLITPFTFIQPIKQEKTLLQFSQSVIFVSISLPSSHPGLPCLCAVKYLQFPFPSRGPLSVLSASNHRIHCALLVLLQIQSTGRHNHHATHGLRKFVECNITRALFLYLNIKVY